MPPLARTRTGCARLLIDRVAAAVRARLLTCKARQRPGRTTRVRKPHAHGEPQILTILLHDTQQGFLSAKEMRATCQIDHQPIFRLGRDPGAELARPALHRLQKRLFRGLAAGTGDEALAHRMRIAHRLTNTQPGLHGRRVKRRNDLRVVQLFHHRQRHIGQHRVPAHKPVRPELREPQGKNASGFHRGSAQT